MKLSSKLFSLVFWVCLMVLPSMGFSQNDEIEKKIAKAEKLIENDKSEDAEKLLADLAKKYPTEGKVWETLVQVQLGVLEEKKKLDKIFNNMTITTKDKNGNEIKDDSLATNVLKLMATIKPSEVYKRHIINTCRLACTQSREAYYPSMVIRIFQVDGDPSKGVKEDAMKEFQKAEVEFGKKNYTSAATYYQKAIDLDNNFYKAKLYLGDMYYYTKRYDLALKEFKDAIATRPDLLEPRKYLFDALNKTGEYEKAYNVAIEAMAVYPDFTMMGKLEDAAKSAGIKCDMHWTHRDVLPNAMKKVEEEKDDIVLAQPKQTLWKYYAEAMEKVKQYSSDKGILSANSITTQKYMEVYCWEYMLGKTGPNEFEFARKMKDKGMLDCYVLVSCFHQDFYDQFLDFAANNKQRIKDYFAELKQQK